MSTAARLLIVDDPLPEQADAVIVLGGGMSHRPMEAARLYQLGVARHVLVAYPANHMDIPSALIPSEGELASTLLVKLGIPESSISPLGHHVSSTRDEAQAALRWVNAHPCRRLIAPTDLLHTRRVKWMFERALRGTDVKVSMTAIYNKRYTAENWWHWEDGLAMFQSEMIKLLFYWISYR